MTPRGARPAQLGDDRLATKRALLVTLVQLYVRGSWRDGRPLTDLELVYVRDLGLRIAADVFPPELDR